jgi:hypothetical protein
MRERENKRWVTFNKGFPVGKEVDSAIGCGSNTSGGFAASPVLIETCDLV